MKQLLLAALVIPAICHAQLTEKSKTIAELGQGGNVINLVQLPVSNQVGLFFNNRRYSHLIDIQHIMFATKEAYIEFIKAMKSVDADHVFHADEYMISGEKGSFGFYLTVYNADRTAYFSLPAKRIRLFEEAADKIK